MLSLGCDGDAGKLDIVARIKLRMAKALTANGLHYASLLYVWRADVPVDTVEENRHTDRVRMVVVESGEEKLDRWVTIRRNVLEDYRKAFGEEPGNIVAVGVLTDVGDDGSRRRAYYGDITMRQNQELHRELDVDHAAAVVLDIEQAAGIGVGGEHFFPHGKNFFPQGFNFPRTTKDPVPGPLECRADLPVAGAKAGARQRLVL